METSSSAAVSFRGVIAQGETVALLGPNGAGTAVAGAAAVLQWRRQAGNG